MEIFCLSKFAKVTRHKIIFLWLFYFNMHFIVSSYEITRRHEKKFPTSNNAKLLIKKKIVFTDICSCIKYEVLYKFYIAYIWKKY